MAPAKDIEAEAARWLESSVCEGWSSEQQEELNEWLAVSLSHRVAFVRLKAAWNETNRLAALCPAASGDVERSPFLSRCSPRLVLRVAAVVLLAIVGIAAYVNLSVPKSPSVYATPVGGHEIIRLSDGSTVELNTNTSLRVSVSADRRMVWLDRGEAYFQINHDPVRPFIVMAGTRRITDLGTKFVVRREPDRLKVAVVEGRVWLDAVTGKAQSALVDADQSAVVTERSISITRKSGETLADSLGWRHGVLVFDDTTLADAVTEFNRYNHQKMVIADREAASQTIGGTFPKDNVEAFTRVARQILGLRISNNGKQIIISRR